MLVQEYPCQRASDSSVALEELRARVEGITGISSVELSSRGRSTAVATLPVRNAWEGDRLKDLLIQQLDGWKVVEAVQYSLPMTF